MGIALLVEVLFPCIEFRIGMKLLEIVFLEGGNELCISSYF